MVYWHNLHPRKTKEGNTETVNRNLHVDVVVKPCVVYMSEVNVVWAWMSLQGHCKSNRKKSRWTCSAGCIFWRNDEHCSNDPEQRGISVWWHGITVLVELLDSRTTNYVTRECMHLVYCTVTEMHSLRCSRIMFTHTSQFTYISVLCQCGEFSTPSQWVNIPNFRTTPPWLHFLITSQ